MVDGLEIDEVENFLEDFLNDEFETIADDGSVTEIASKCCQFYNLLKQNKSDELLKLLPSLPVLQTQARQVKVVKRNIDVISDANICYFIDAQPFNPLFY